MRKSINLLVISFFGFLVFQLIAPFAFGMGELVLGRISWGNFGHSQSKDSFELLNTSILWIGPLLLNSIYFAISIILLNASRSIKKAQHEVKINRILFGIGLYFIIYSATSFISRLTYDYLSYFTLMSNPYSSSHLYVSQNVFFGVNLVAILLMIYFILSAFKKK